MLYHWYELDLNSAPAAHHGPARQRMHDATFNYDALAAIKRARGGSVRSDFADFELTAVNDHQTDQQAVRLREAGLGRICKFNVASHVGVAYNMQQINQRFCYALCVTYCSALSMIYFLRQWCQGTKDRRSHKMVVNGTEHSAHSTYGAQRQRFQPSVKQQAK